MAEVSEATCVCPACGGVCKLGLERCAYCGSPFVAALGPGTRDGDDPRRLVAELAAAAEKKPNDSALRAKLGRAWHRCGEFEKAQEQLDLAVELDPQNAEAFYLLAWNAAIRNGWTSVEIEKQARFALALKPIYPEAEALVCISRGVQRQLFGGEGADDEAFEQFEKAAQVDPANAYGWYYAALVCEKRGQLDEARRRLESAASDALQDMAPAPADARIFTRLGLVCAELDDAEGARKYLGQAVALDPDNEAARDFLKNL